MEIAGRVPYGVYQLAVKKQDEALAMLSGIETLNDMLKNENTKLHLQIKELEYQIES